jgi:hypothetical protein
MLLLDESLPANGTPVVWSGESGSLSVALTGETELTVAMSDVVLRKQRLIGEPEVRRTVSGTITGAWIVEHSDGR